MLEGDRSFPWLEKMPTDAVKVADRIAEEMGLKLPVAIDRLLPHFNIPQVSESSQSRNLYGWSPIGELVMTDRPHYYKAIELASPDQEPLMQFAPERRITIAHEVGHAVGLRLGLYTFSVTARGMETEAFCEAFASAILAPGNLLRAEADKIKGDPLELFHRLYLSTEMPAFHLAKRIIDTAIGPSFLYVIPFGDSGRKYYQRNAGRFCGPDMTDFKYFISNPHRQMHDQRNTQFDGNWDTTVVLYERYFKEREDYWKQKLNIPDFLEEAYLEEFWSSREDPNHHYLYSVFEGVIEGMVLDGKEGPQFALISIKKGTQLLDSLEYKEYSKTDIHLRRDYFGCEIIDWPNANHVWSTVRIKNQFC